MTTRFPWPRLRPVAFALALAAVGCGSDDAGDETDAGADAAGSEADAGAPVGDDGYFPADVPPGFSLFDYGDVPVVGGETAELVFDAGADVSSFFVVATAPPGSFVVVLSVRDPDGNTLVTPEPLEDDFVVDQYFAGFAGPSTSPNRVAGRPRAMAAMIPNTPRIAMTAGSWRFQIGVFQLGADENAQPANVPLDGVVHVGVVAREGDAPSTGTIDLAISLHPSSGLDAASAADDAVLQDAIATVDTALKGVGVSIGSVVYLDLDAELPQPLDLGGPSCLGGDIEQVFAAAEPVPDVVHLVLLGSFTCLRFGGKLDAGASLAAVSNGVPGIPFARRDGIVVATALMNDFPEDWSLVLAHEIGHYLGLFHTRDLTSVFDNIADTDDDAPADYLMFPDVSQSRSTLVTADQGAIIRRHPLVLER